jgi:hypothetical protein
LVLNLEVNYRKIKDLNSPDGREILFCFNKALRLSTALRHQAKVGQDMVKYERFGH